MSISLDIQLTDETVRRLKTKLRTGPVLSERRRVDIPVVARNPARKFTAEFLGRVHKTAQRNLRSDTGKTRRQGKIIHDEVFGRITWGGAASYIHGGRKPGKFPPPGALAGWARRHGMPEFPVARKIAMRGIPPRPFLADAFREVRSVALSRDLEVMAGEVEREWGRL